MTARSGRRPGARKTRDAISEAARSRFADVGYDRTTIRAIAADAGVDPALVLHFFGSKQGLFVSVMRLPQDPEVVFARVFEGDRSEAGLRLARFAVSLLEDPVARSVLTGIVRAAASEPEAARMVRELVSEQLLGPLARSLGMPDPELRASLVGSQMVGLVMARHVVGIEPLASFEAEELAAAIAPNLQRYLTGRLS